MENEPKYQLTLAQLLLCLEWGRMADKNGCIDHETYRQIFKLLPKEVVNLYKELDDCNSTFVYANMRNNYREQLRNLKVKNIEELLR